MWPMFENFVFLFFFFNSKQLRHSEKGQNVNVIIEIKTIIFHCTILEYLHFLDALFTNFDQNMNLTKNPFYKIRVRWTLLFCEKMLTGSAHCIFFSKICNAWRQNQWIFASTHIQIKTKTRSQVSICDRN